MRLLLIAGECGGDGVELRGWITDGIHRGFINRLLGSELSVRPEISSNAEIINEVSEMKVTKNLVRKSVLNLKLSEYR